jgi:hypothetical protein
MSSPLIASFVYSATAPMYIYGLGNAISSPSQFQPAAGMLIASANSTNGVSPVSPIYLSTPEQYFNSHLRVLAVLPANASLPSAFGPYAHSFIDTTSVLIDRGTAKFQLVIGKLSSKQPTGLTQVLFSKRNDHF